MYLSIFFSPPILGYYSSTQAEEINSFFSRKVSRDDLLVFVKLCDNCKDHGGVNNEENRIFISVNSPSCAGKTQMSVSLDSLSVFPLSGGRNDKAPLFMVFRISVDLFQKGKTSQTINVNLFADFFKKFSQLDYDTLHAAYVEKNPNLTPEKLSESISSIVSGSHISETFSSKKSHLLSLMLFWIQSRRNGKESESFQAALKKSTLKFKGFVSPLTLVEFKNQTNKLNPENKTIVAALDEFNITKFAANTGKPVMLRNILREARFAVITMGTNSKASNLIDTVSKGGGSGTEAAPWVHVVTNVFSNTPIIEEASDLTLYKHETWYEAVNNWISKSPCFRPGILRLFLLAFRELVRTTSFEVAFRMALEAVGDEMRRRKAMGESPFWLIGQVAALLPRYRALENGVPVKGGDYNKSISVVVPADDDEGGKRKNNQNTEKLDVKKDENSDEKKTYDILLSEHYAYLQTYSAHESAYFFTLQRVNTSLYVSPWNKEESRDGKLNFSYSGAKLSSFPKIEFSEDELFAKAASVVQVKKSVAQVKKSTIPVGEVESQETDLRFKGFSVYPSFQSDELSLMCLFSVEPFKILRVTLNDDFVDVADRIIGHEELQSRFVSLTSRAAVTIFHQKLYGRIAQDQNDKQKSKRPVYFLESVAMIATVIATRRSLSGTQFLDYLPRLVGELSMRKTDLELDQACISQLGDIGSFIFPYIPVVGGMSSIEFMNLPGVNCGYISFVRDSQGVDGIGHANCLSERQAPGYSKETAVYFTGEQKLHSKRILFTTIKDSCQKAKDCRKAFKSVKGRPTRVHFHFIIVAQIDKRINWEDDRHKIFDNQPVEQHSKPCFSEKSIKETLITERRIQPSRSAKKKSDVSGSDDKNISPSPAVIVCDKVEKGKLSVVFYGDEPNQKHQDDAPLFCLVIIPVENLFPHDGKVGYERHEDVILDHCECSLVDCSDNRCGFVKRSAKCTSGCHENCKNQDNPMSESTPKSAPKARFMDEAVSSSKMRKV